jgi:hypothetical protein
MAERCFALLWTRPKRNKLIPGGLLMEGSWGHL